MNYEKLWVKKYLYPIVEKGIIGKCSNQRTIGLIVNTSKALLKIIAKQIQKNIIWRRGEGRRTGMLCRKERSRRTDCQYHKYHRKMQNMPLYICFMDYTKAFDYERNRSVGYHDKNGFSSAHHPFFAKFLSASTGKVQHPWRRGRQTKTWCQDCTIVGMAAASNLVEDREGWHAIIRISAGQTHANRF